MTKWTTIAKHEYIYNIKRKEFLLVTLGLPLFIFAIMGLPFLLAGNIISHQEYKIGFVDQTGLFEPLNFSSFSTEELAQKDLLEGKISYYFVIPADYKNSGRIIIYSSKMDFSGSGEVEGQIKNFLLDNLLHGENKELLERLKDPIIGEYFTISEGGKIRENGFSAFLVPIAFAAFFMFSIFTSSIFLLQGIVEEKESRVMEILLSSVSYRELLTGKIFGLGAVGLTQIIIWQIIGIGILSSAQRGIMLSKLNVSPGLLVIGSGYFILGYLVFACIMAGVGAVATTSREGQQMAGIFTITGAMPLIISQFIIANPGSILSAFLSYFPLTSPITMIIRLSAGEVKFYELMISLIILTISILIIIEMSVRIFRASLLMYGKKPAIREIIKYLSEG
ncbi:MAG: ABC transporter permease [Candidatus Methanoperedens sp.]|nr:ABC transporter permease [Candidatus Methanoperedens sp.]